MHARVLLKWLVSSPAFNSLTFITPCHHFIQLHNLYRAASVLIHNNICLRYLIDCRWVRQCVGVFVLWHKIMTLFYVESGRCGVDVSKRYYCCLCCCKDIVASFSFSSEKQTTNKTWVYLFVQSPVKTLKQIEIGPCCQMLTSFTSYYIVQLTFTSDWYVQTEKTKKTKNKSYLLPVWYCLISYNISQKRTSNSSENN